MNANVPVGQTPTGPPVDRACPDADPPLRRMPGPGHPQGVPLPYV